MRRRVLRAKLHRARVTRRDVDYEGSLTLDADLLDAIGAWPNEAVAVYDLANGERFETYLIAGERGSGEVCVNGAAAKLVAVDDPVILACYGSVDEADGPPPEPRIVLVDAQNRVVERRGS